jgi:AraC-like DNA-binding protein
VRIAIGSDGSAENTQEGLRLALAFSGHSLIEVAWHGLGRARGHGYSAEVARTVLRKRADCGIVLSSHPLEACHVANNVPCARAAVCYDRHSAEIRVIEEKMNILVLPCNALDSQEALAIVNAYIIRGCVPLDGIKNVLLYRWQEVFSYIQDNIALDLPVAKLAQRCNLSTYYFSRLFKDGTGTTPHQYVLRQRIEHARKFLLETNTPLAEISRQTGFKHQSHFTRVFRRMVGIGPKHYRTSRTI